MKLKRLADQVVVVFGASSGIGRATALRLASKGARVVAAGRNREGLETLATDIRARGGQCITTLAEASDFEQVGNAAKEAVERFGHLDTWIHVAGVGVWSKVEETRPEEIRRVMEVNFYGQVYGAMAALPHIRREGRGALIHISSVEALVSPPYQAAYAASKHALNGFLDSLRVELLAERVPIAVTEVMPAGVNTPLFDKGLCRLGVKPKPVPPMYEPEVVSELIVYAAEHRRRRLYAGGAAKFFMTAESWMPGTSDFVIRMTAIKGQRTDQAKPPGGPDNLFHTLEGYNSVRNGFSDRAFGSSIYNWVQMHPGLQAGAALSVIGLLGAVAVRKIRA